MALLWLGNTSHQHVHQEKRLLSLWHPATIQATFETGLISWQPEF